MKRRSFGLAVAAAVALVTFLADYGIGGRSAGGREELVEEKKADVAPVAAAVSQFTLLLFENDRYEVPGDDAAMTARVQEYGGWARSIAETGRFVSGEKLSDEGCWCRMEAGAMTVAKPIADAGRGVLAGYFVIGAADFDEALKLANTCPHLKYGGSVEIRRIET